MSDSNQTQPPVLTEEVKPRMLRLYRSGVMSCSYFFGSLLGPDGKPKYPELNGHKAVFIDGRYATDDHRQIEELDAQIKAGLRDIYIDPREPEVDSRFMDPLFRLKEQMKQQILKELGLDPNRDMGSYAPSKLNPATSQTVAPVAAGGNGQNTNLAAVKALLGAAATSQTGA